MCNRLTVASAAYLAGLIDGEGSIVLYRRRNKAALRLLIANTNIEVLQWCVAATGVGAILKKKPVDPIRHKQGATWEASSQAAESVLSSVKRFLIIKREQAKIAIEFQRRLRIPKYKADAQWQQEYRTRIQSLNARGPLRSPNG